MKEQKKIGLLSCFIGKLPWYFDYFIHSCRYNPTIDFFIITNDKTYKEVIPANVSLIYKTLDDISLVATEKLGFPIKISQGYKLCDFKPTYGLLFDDLLSGYDFWGYTDIDIIFGNIRDFLTEDLLDNYDLISARPDWIPGCFLVFKNVEKMNTLFASSKDYKKVFGSEKHYCFDETNFTHQAFEDGESYLNINSEVESMMHVVKKMEEKGQIKPHFDLYMIEGGRPGKLKWENGEMVYKNRFQILLYHLIQFKRYYVPKSKVSNIPDYFTISPTQIYHQRTACK